MYKHTLVSTTLTSLLLHCSHCNYNVYTDTIISLTAIQAANGIP